MTALLYDTKGEISEIQNHSLSLSLSKMKEEYCAEFPTYRVYGHWPGQYLHPFQTFNLLYWKSWYISLWKQDESAYMVILIISKHQWLLPNNQTQFKVICTNFFFFFLKVHFRIGINEAILFQKVSSEISWTTFFNKWKQPFIFPIDFKFSNYRPQRFYYIPKLRRESLTSIRNTVKMSLRNEKKRKKNHELGGWSESNTFYN